MSVFKLSRPTILNCDHFIIILFDVKCAWSYKIHNTIQTKTIDQDHVENQDCRDVLYQTVGKILTVQTYFLNCQDRESRLRPCRDKSRLPRPTFLFFVVLM